MRSGRIAGVLTVVLIFASTAPHRARARRGFGGEPLTGRARTTAIAAVENLRDLLNQGACQAIYDEASDLFRNLEPRREWLRDCGDIREKLGTWQAFGQDAEMFELHSLQESVADGPAVFERGSGQAIIQWRRIAGRMKLDYLALRADGEMVSVPDYQRSLRRYMDPPLRQYRDSPMEQPRRPYGA
jgi:hypothetical protein